MTDPEPALVGIDFTASTLRIALADLDGQVLHRQDFPLPPVEDEDAWAWEVGGRVATCFAAEGNHRWAAGIGISCPGIVDPIAGRIVESTVVEAWDGLNVVAALRRHIDAPIVAIGRAEAGLRGEAAAGAAAETFDALYVSMEDVPSAALLSSGRVVGGMHGRAGALPAFPEIAPGSALASAELEQAVALLTDLTMFADPSVVVIHGALEHAQPLVSALMAVFEQVAPDIDVVPAALGENAALLGALKAAATVAFEGDADEVEGRVS